MSSGKFIAFEGGEGAGKSTQANLLAKALAERGVDTIMTREPGGTPGAEAIRELLLSKEGEGWNPRAEALLFAAARSDHVERLIAPSLREGKWVFCDRFLDSSRAYQGGGGGLADSDITTLHQLGSIGLLPHLTILIEVPPDAVARRLAERDAGGTDRIGGRDAEYHARVAERFAMLADAEPERFARIDGSGGVEEVHERIMAAVTPLLDEAGL